MTYHAIPIWFRRHQWLLAVTVVAVMGYTVGKDRALRDNASGLAARPVTSSSGSTGGPSDAR